MNPLLQSILDKLQSPENLTPEHKDFLLKALKEEDKHQAQLQSKLDRAEKDQRTLSVMLEESIEDLQKKNKDLEIESSLERVRTVAMGMRSPEDLLAICESLFQELQKLGFSELRNSMINIYDDEKTSFLNFDYSNHAGKTITPHFYNSHPVIQHQVNQVRSSLDAFSEVVFAGEDLKDWKKIRKEKGEPEDPKVDAIDSLYYYFYSIGTGAIGISAYSPIPEARLNVLKRFRNVFDFAYRRYADVTQAEAQAKEARIEASLERVRAQAMSIRKSEALAEVVEAIFEELKSLGFVDLRNTEVIINNDGKESILSYYYSDYGITGSIEVFYKTNPTVQHWAQELKKASDAFAKIEIPETEIDAWRKYREEIGYAPDPKLNEAKSVFYYSYSTGLGALSISSFAPVSDEQINILERFKNVFGLAYRRYADLTQAEAQAREARIELALERVRARTMAMQKSEELSETAFILFQQFRELGEEPIQLTIGIYHEAEGVIAFRVTDWAGGGSQIDREFNLSIEEPTLLKKAFTAWKEQKKSLVVDLTGKELQGWIDYRNAHTGVSIQSNDTGGRRVVSIAFFSKGHISISSAEPRSPETILLLERFAGVFDLTYTRFLDLKNAESQIREAKIEAALERTRTQSMLMLHSRELDDTLRVFHEQVLLLGIHSAFSFLWLPDEEKNRHVFWAAWAENNSSVFRSKTINYPLDRNEPATKQCLIDWKSDEPVYSYAVPPEGVENYFAAWKELIDGVEKLKPEYFRNGLYYVEAFMKYGCFGVMTSVDLTIDEKKILDRFAVEFERAYTRFLDLQKAEAQAREARIENALERVRSKTIAMHNSQDVGDTVSTLFDELVKLGITTNRCGILIFTNTTITEVWTAKANPQGDATLIIGHLDVSIHPMLQYVRSAWIDKEPLFSYELESEDLKNYYQAINDAQYYPTRFKMDALPLTEIHTDFYFGEGCIFAFTAEPIPSEFADIFKRFAGVFGQTYRRFLDLQKAEAQAREAKIEASLEKVRGRAMAMHASQDLSTTSSMVFGELRKLGIDPIRCGVGLLTKESRRAQLYSATSAPEGNHRHWRDGWN